MSENLTVRTANSSRTLRTFIALPAKIHRNHPNWVPPIYLDEKTYFNRRKNISFAHCDTLLLLAYRRKKAVGRIMGIINHKYNTLHNLKEARFCYLETFDDYEVAGLLVESVECWARERGMERLVGPLGFSDKDPQGLLVEGFDEPVVIATNCNFPYMVQFIEKLGYGKKTDLVVYKLNIPDEIPPFYRKIHERVVSHNGYLKVVHFTSRRQMKKYVRPVLKLVNETFIDIYAFAPLSEKEMKEFANRYIYFLDPSFLKVIENSEGEVVAFILGMADISEGIRKCKGRLIPYGIFQILEAKRKTSQLNLLLGAIREEYRNHGLDVLLGISLLESARDKNMKVIDSHLELESNLKVRSEMEKMGGVVYKRYRIFEKSLVVAPLEN